MRISFKCVLYRIFKRINCVLLEISPITKVRIIGKEQNTG